MSSTLETNDAIINLKLLKNYVLKTIQKENLTDTCTDVKNDISCSETMVFNFYERIIKINYDYCLSTIKQTYIDMDYYCDSFISKTNHTNKWDSKEFRANIINLFLMYYANHEIQHVRQFNVMKNMASDNMSQLLLFSYGLHRLDSEQNDGEYYQQYHDKFFFEYQANAISGHKTIEQFTNNQLIGNDELELFNMFVAAKILDGYVGMNNKLSDKANPIQFLSNLSKILNYYRHPLIEVFESKEIPSNNVDDLLNGRRIPDDILNEITNIAFGKVKTLNLYNHLYSEEKYKYNIMQK